jgi:quinol monooxygenase YgiN
MENFLVGGLKTILVKAGHEREFEQLFKELRQEMISHEPDCLLYSLLKSRTTPGAYIVQEQYIDQAALNAHEASAYGASYFPRIRAILDDITVEYFDCIVE